MIYGWKLLTQNAAFHFLLHKTTRLSPDDTESHETQNLQIEKLGFQLFREKSSG